MVIDTIKNAVEQERAACLAIVEAAIERTTRAAVVEVLARVRDQILQREFPEFNKDHG